MNTETRAYAEYVPEGRQICLRRERRKGENYGLYNNG